MKVKKWKEMRESMKSWKDESEPRVSCRSGWSGLTHYAMSRKETDVNTSHKLTKFSEADVFRAKVVKKGKEDEIERWEGGWEEVFIFCV